jgi:hypothetical protein
MPEPITIATAAAMKLLGTVVERIAEWGELAIGRARTNREQRAAYFLRNAGFLVAALRTLDNSWHKVMGQLRLLDSAWPSERREHVIGQINDFASQEMVVPIIRQSVRELEAANISRDLEDIGLPDLTKQLEELLESGKTILAAVGESPVTPFKDPTELRRFFTNIRQARTAEEVESLTQDLEEALGVLDRRILANVDEAFSELRHSILNRYPTLPDPGWVVSLEDIKAST